MGISSSRPSEESFGAHAEELLAAGKLVFTELKNLCFWNKSNAGMGTFYRSKHELVFVFKKGTAAHVNSFGLGETGRPRSNVWDYPGVSSIGPSRMEELAMHPTVKPTRLVADAIKDCSRRGDLVLEVLPVVLAECVFVLESFHEHARGDASVLGRLISNPAIEISRAAIHRMPWIAIEEQSAISRTV